VRDYHRRLMARVRRLKGVTNVRIGRDSQGRPRVIVRIGKQVLLYPVAWAPGDNRRGWKNAVADIRRQVRSIVGGVVPSKKRKTLKKHRRLRRRWPRNRVITVIESRQPTRLDFHPFAALLVLRDRLGSS
jgi:hypothetical protein